MRENTDQNNSEYGHFLCSDVYYWTSRTLLVFSAGELSLTARQGYWYPMWNRKHSNTEGVKLRKEGLKMFILPEKLIVLLPLEIFVPSFKIFVVLNWLSDFQIYETLNILNDSKFYEIDFTD